MRTRIGFTGPTGRSGYGKHSHSQEEDRLISARLVPKAAHDQKQKQKLKGESEKEMVNYVLKITADLENLTNLQPSGGCDDPNFPYLFKLKCERCGEVTQKETCVNLNETFTPPGGRGTCHLVQKCKFCGRDGNVTMIPGKGRPFTLEDSEAGAHAPLMVFDCRGYEPIDFGFGGFWKAEAESGTKFDDIDLSSGEEFTEYDEKGECPVMISNFRASFSVTK